MAKMNSLSIESKILYETTCKYIWRQSNSSGWIKQSDNSAIVHIIESSKGKNYHCSSGIWTQI